MYTPKKGWMRWKKIIKRNLIEKNGETVYKLGEMSWQRHCIIFGDLINLHYSLVAALFPITSFEEEFLIGQISGSDDVYSFDMLDRHGDSILKKYDRGHKFFRDSKFRLNINRNLIQRLNDNGMLEKMEIELGCGKTNIAENTNGIFLENGAEKLRSNFADIYSWGKDFVFDE